MDPLRRHRIRHLTQAVYRHEDPDSTPAEVLRFLPSMPVAVALIVVVILATTVGLLRAAATNGRTNNVHAEQSMDPSGAPDSGKAISRSEESQSLTPPGEASTSLEEPNAAVFYVHVTGAVNTSGVVEVSEGTRVIDAVSAAGGLTNEADIAAINLARKVSDGEHIHVPIVGESPMSARSQDNKKSAACVDLNQADSTKLETLHGIGPALAERIIAYRTEYGPFSSADDLDAVSGIGPTVIERLRDEICQ